MAGAAVALLDHPDRVRLALSPIRRRLLERLRTPASATELGDELAIGRQRANYHLRALEAAGLLELVEERQRRGCVERILAARAQAFVVDPAVMTGRAAHPVSPGVQDRFAAAHLVDTAASTVRDVARMQSRADGEGKRLLTFTIETVIECPTPAHLERFTTALAAFVARQARNLSRNAAGGRRYRVVLSGYPAPRESAPSSPAAAQPPGGSHERVRSRPRRNPRRRAD
jgi:DNA-binding transcriptional ArsR family regulator